MRTPRFGGPRRVGSAVVLAIALVITVAGPAAAHVTLHSYEAVQGGSDALVQVRVPNEEDSATVTQLELDFPAATPLIGLYVQPTPGWTFAVTNTTLPTPVTTDDGTITDYVSKVIWTGGSIPVGGFQDFDIDVSQLPSVPSITVKALQYYSNGDIVRWIELPGPQGQVPDHPAPMLTLAPAPVASAASGAPTTTTPAAAAAAATKSSTSDSTARTLSIVALVIGALAIAAAGTAISLARRS